MKALKNVITKKINKQLFSLALILSLFSLLVLPVFTMPAVALTLREENVKTLNELKTALAWAEAHPDQALDIYVTDNINIDQNVGDLLLVIPVNTHLYITANVTFQINNGHCTLINKGVIHLYGAIKHGGAVVSEDGGIGVVYDGSKIMGNKHWVTNGVVYYERETWCVTFYPNGGAFIDYSRLAYVSYVLRVGGDGHVNVPPEVARYGFEFDDWYTSPEGGTQWNFNTDVVTGDLNLYACWTPVSMTVTFDSNPYTGGDAEVSLPSPASKVVAFDEPYGVLPVLSTTNSGYVFIGWSASSELGGVLITEESLVADVTDHVLYAQWAEQADIVVYFNANADGDSSVVLSETFKVVKASSTYGELATGSRVGYSFMGWFNDTVGGVEITSGSQTPPVVESGRIDLYAKWECTSYYVRYFERDPDLRDIPITADIMGLIDQGAVTLADLGVVDLALEGLVDDPIGHHMGDVVNVLYSPPAAPGSIFDRSGWMFMGWFDLYNLISLSEPTFVMPASNVLLIAWWEPVQYTVTFDGNGGYYLIDGDETKYTDDFQTMSYLEGGALSANKFVRSGYSFLGWSTDAADIGIKYADEYLFAAKELSGDMHLYAVWELDTYSIEYDLNGAPLDLIVEGAVGYPVSYKVDQQFPISVADPLPWAYKFKGWTVEYVNGTIIDGLQLGDVISAGSYGDVKLTANWGAPIVSYNISYVLNGGVNALGNPLSYDADTLPLNINAPSRRGFTFLGWTIRYENGSSVTVPPALSYSIPAGTTGDVVLSALWVDESVVDTLRYSVTYDANGAMGGSVPVDGRSPYVSGSVVGVLGVGSLVREGYTFQGWSTDAETSSPMYVLGSTFTIFSDVTLYAVWTKVAPPIMFTVTFDSGTHVAFERVTYTVLAGESTPTAPVVESESGWAFKGWTPIIADTVTENVEYVAQWTQVFTVTFKDGNGNTLMVEQIEYGGMAHPPTPPTRAGYTFTAWTGNCDIDNIICDATFTPQYTQNTSDEQSGGSASSGSSLGKSSNNSNKQASTPITLPSDVTIPVEYNASADEPKDELVLQGWALINLILSTTGIVLAIVGLAFILLQHRQSQQNQKNDGLLGQSKFVWAIVALSLGIVSVLLFVLTSDFSRAMGLVDRWTIVNAILFIIETIIITFTLKRNTKK